MKHCALLPDDPNQSENQPRPPGGRCIDELPRLRSKPEGPKPISVALLKHSQRSFVRTARHPKAPNHPNRKAPPPALLFLPSTMSKNRRKTTQPKTADETTRPLNPARSRPPVALKSPKPATPLGAALGPRYIGASNPSCQAIHGGKSENRPPSPAAHCIGRFKPGPASSRQADRAGAGTLFVRFVANWALAVNQTETQLRRDCRRLASTPGGPQTG